MSYLFITSTKNKRNTFHVSSLSTKWFHITLPSCCCNQNCAQTFPLLHVLCREVSSAVCWVLENYHPSCSSAQAHSLGLWTAIKLWGFYPTHNLQDSHSALPGFHSSLAGTTKTHQPVNRQSGALLPSSAQPLSSDMPQCRRQNKDSPFQRSTKQPAK